jgi:hypothetical protein
LIVPDHEFCEAHQKTLFEMIGAAVSLQALPYFAEGGLRKKRLLLNRPAHGLDTEKKLTTEWKPPKLVLTSPPYPGVHILYHRWQVRGRRETGAPFWITGHEDGHPPTFYTMGTRFPRGFDAYLNELAGALHSIVRLMDPDSIMVQLVGFSEPSMQLGPYLATLESVGLAEVQSELLSHKLKRVWRTVPNRRWYNRSAQRRLPSKEVLLVHRLKR